MAVCWLHTVITWSPTLTDFTAAWPAAVCATGSWMTSPLSGDGLVRLAARSVDQEDGGAVDLGDHAVHAPQLDRLLHAGNALQARALGEHRLGLRVVLRRLRGDHEVEVVVPVGVDDVADLERRVVGDEVGGAHLHAAEVLPHDVEDAALRMEAVDRAALEVLVGVRHDEIFTLRGDRQRQGRRREGGAPNNFNDIRRFMCNMTASPFGSSFTVQGGPSHVRCRMCPPDVTEACLTAQRYLPPCCGSEKLCRLCRRCADRGIPQGTGQPGRSGGDLGVVEHPVSRAGGDRGPARRLSGAALGRARRPADAAAGSLPRDRPAGRVGALSTEICSIEFLARLPLLCRR